MSSTDKDKANKDDLTKKDTSAIVRYYKDEKKIPEHCIEVLTAYFNPYLGCFSVGIHGINNFYHMSYMFETKKKVAKFVEGNTNKKTYIQVDNQLAEYFDKKEVKYDKNIGDFD
jgi:hypothetical protein